MVNSLFLTRLHDRFDHTSVYGISWMRIFSFAGPWSAPLFTCPALAPTRIPSALSSVAPPSGDCNQQSTRSSRSFPSFFLRSKILCLLLLSPHLGYSTINRRRIFGPFRDPFLESAEAICVRPPPMLLFSRVPSFCHPSRLADFSLQRGRIFCIFRLLRRVLSFLGPFFFRLRLQVAFFS